MFFQINPINIDVSVVSPERGFVVSVPDDVSFPGDGKSHADLSEMKIKLLALPSFAEVWFEQIKS